MQLFIADRLVQPAIVSARFVENLVERGIAKDIVVKLLVMVTP